MQTINLKQAEALVAGINIPPRPAVLQAILEQQQSDNPNLQKISEAISTDVSLSASVLKTVNSPLYGLRSKVNSVQHGVMMLGMKNISHLVTGLSLRLAVRGGNKVSLERFWDTAADTAMLARALSRELFAGDQDDAYLLGLFHDCGIPLLMLKHPEYSKFLKEANNSPDREFTEMEEENFNTNHAIIGYYVANNWRLPEHICTAIQRHHELDAILNEDSSLTSLISLLWMAEHICHRARRLTDDHGWLRVMPRVLEHFDLDNDQFEHLVADMASRIES